MYKIIEHLRDEHRKPFATLVILGEIFNGKTSIVHGYSICNPCEKQFSKKRGIQIAEGRAILSKALIDTSTGTLYTIIPNRYVTYKEVTMSMRRMMENRILNLHQKMRHRLEKVNLTKC
jgi:hypothetical protein